LFRNGSDGVARLKKMLNVVTSDRSTSVAREWFFDSNREKKIIAGRRLTSSRIQRSQSE
jgi:hypothetical protein